MSTTVDISSVYQTGAVYGYSDLEPLDWDFSHPTIKRPNYPLCLRTEQRALANIAQNYPMFDGLNTKNITIAGGAVSCSLIDKIPPSPDCDVFIYGISDTDEATARVRSFISDITQQCNKITQRERDAAFITQCHENAKRLPATGKCPARTAFIEIARVFSEGHVSNSLKNYGDDKWGVDIQSYAHLLKGPNSVRISAARFEIDQVRTKNAVTLVINRNSETYIIQLILRLNASIQDIVEGFDIGSSGVAIDFAAPKTSIVFSPSARFAYSRGYNVVDCRRHTDVYVSRLNKYKDRGFGLILPHLSISAIPHDNLNCFLGQAVLTPTIMTIVTSISGNCMKAGCLSPATRAGRQPDYPEHQDHDYDDVTLVYQHPRVTARINLRAVLDGRFAEMTYTVTDDEIIRTERADLTVLDVPPAITLTAAIAIYNRMKSTVYDECRLNLAQLRNFITVEHPDAVARAIVDLGTNSFAVKKYVDTLIDQQISHVSETLGPFLARGGAPPLNWTFGTEIVGTLTSSDRRSQVRTMAFEPKPMTPAEWYGKYCAAEAPIDDLINADVRSADIRAADIRAAAEAAGEAAETATRTAAETATRTAAEAATRTAAEAAEAATRTAAEAAEAATRTAAEAAEAAAAATAAADIANLSMDDDKAFAAEAAAEVAEAAAEAAEVAAEVAEAAAKAEAIVKNMIAGLGDTKP